MGYFSQLDMEKHTAETCADDENNEMDLRAKAEEIDDAKQAAEAKAAQATLAKLAETEAPPEDESEEDETTVDQSPATDETEEQKRKAHEESEAKRKAEWEAKKQAKEEAEFFAWEAAIAMDDNALIAASMKRVGDDAERLTRRNMKQCVTEMIQSYCIEDMELAKQVMHPRKNMVN